MGGAANRRCTWEQFFIEDACAGSSLSFAERRPLRRKDLITPLMDEGARSGEIFLARSEQLLAPMLKKGDVAVMDKLRVQGSSVREAIGMRGTSLLCLWPEP